MERMLGVDFGVARTGVAVSDPLGMTAQGVGTIHSGNVEKVLEEVIGYAKQYEAKTIVVGLPKNMNNTVGERGEACIAFGERLKELTDCEVVMWDERGTSVTANRLLSDAGKKKGKQSL